MDIPTIPYTKEYLLAVEAEYQARATARAALREVKAAEEYTRRDVQARAVEAGVLPGMEIEMMSGKWTLDEVHLIQSEGGWIAMARLVRGRKTMSLRLDVLIAHVQSKRESQAGQVQFGAPAPEED